MRLRSRGRADAGASREHPSHLHASRSLTATSRLAKAVTSPRTPKLRSFGCGSPSPATVGRSPQLPSTVAPRQFTSCCCDPYKEQHPRALQHPESCPHRIRSRQRPFHAAAPGDGRTPNAPDRRTTGASASSRRRLPSSWPQGAFRIADRGFPSQEKQRGGAETAPPLRLEVLRARRVPARQFAAV